MKAGLIDEKIRQPFTGPARLVLQGTELAIDPGVTPSIIEVDGERLSIKQFIIGLRANGGCHTAYV